MVYYKLVTDGRIVDAIRSDTANWIIENRRNYSLYSGEQEFAHGVEATDQHCVYHILGTPVFHDYPEFETVELVEIDESEYTDVMADILAERMSTEEEPVGGDAPEEAEEIAKTRIQMLEEQIEELIEGNAMLTECLLEMSELVYV